MTLQYWIEQSKSKSRGAVQRGGGRVSILGGYYAIRHIPTGRRYVGKSSWMRTRLQNHLAELKRHKHICSPLQADFDRDGSDAFDLEILEYSERLDGRREIWWMHRCALEVGGIYNSIQGQRPSDRNE